MCPSAGIALLQRSDAIVRTITERLLDYALEGETRSLQTGHMNMPAVREVVPQAATSNYRWSSIIEGIVRSKPFQHRRLK